MVGVQQFMQNVRPLRRLYGVFYLIDHCGGGQHCAILSSGTCFIASLQGGGRRLSAAAQEMATSGAGQALACKLAASLRSGPNDRVHRDHIRLR